jgi:hypothetical protein
MPTTAVLWLSLAVNLVAIITAMVSIGRWMRGRIVRSIERLVSAPLVVLNNQIAEVRQIAETAATEAQRANDRLDAHLNTNTHTLIQGA